MDRTHANEVPAVVALGASAGGLAALVRFFRRLPADTGASFIVLQHLAPDSPSDLAAILQRETVMPVTMVDRRQRLERNHVYVIAPGRELVTENHSIAPVEREGAHVPPAPIDRVFRTLAQSHGERAIAVVLSGSGTDGSVGLKAVREAGGLVLVQDPDEAEYSGMPGSAIATRQVDRILTVEALADDIDRILRGPAALAREAPELPAEDDVVDRILTLLDEHTDVDFGEYKPTMLNRRILRRMALVGAASLADYESLLRSDAAERDQLYQDLLVSVTDFFRDEAAFEALRTAILPELVRARAPDQVIRVWVPGCATGEEAYSIAMLLIETMEAEGHRGQLQVFATDLDEQALDIARTGLYPASIAADVDTERLARFFRKNEQYYQVRKHLREKLIFARHDLLTDPPYAHLDLVSCRNLLIYLAAPAQDEALKRFHFALRENGCLFLGSAETVGDREQFFAPAVRGQSLYRRLNGSRSPSERPLPAAAPRMRDTRVALRRPQPPRAVGHNLDHTVQQLLLREYVPASVVVNRDNEVLCSYGPTRDYLALPTGASHLDVMEMAHEPVQATLRIALRKARGDNAEARISIQPGSGDPDPTNIRISARPLHDSPALEGLVLVTFERLPSEPSEPVARDSGGDARADKLAEELRVTQEELEDKVHSLSAANEELRGSSEEVLSMNEELQATNEELETSREEMQSLNEELSTTNQELHHKLDELERTTDDLANLFESTQVATLILDRNLNIQRYTPTARELVHLIASDIGRSLDDLKLRFEDPALLDDARAVMEDLQVREREIQAEEDTWYLRRITPYRTGEDIIGGVVITLTDIDALKRAELSARRGNRRWHALANAVPAMIAYVDARGRIEFGNAALSNWLGEQGAHDNGSEQGAPAGERPLVELFPEEDTDALASWIDDALQGRNVAFEARIPGPELRDVHVALVPVDSGDVVDGGCYAVITDITERKRIETEHLQQYSDFAEAHRLVSMHELVATLAHQLNQPLGAISNYAATLENRLDGSDKDTELAHTIGLQARSAARVLEEMRGFINERTPEEKDIDINHLIQRVLVLTEARQRIAEATVETRLAEDLPFVHGSEIQVEQALLNLMINALEAVAGRDARQLTLETRTDERHDRVEIRVTDTGPGISPEQLQRLMEPFFTTKDDGMGMGLAISNSIAEEHGGRLAVESAPGAGTTFILHLPASGTAEC